MSCTPPDATSAYILDNLKGNEFDGFSFVNSEFDPVTADGSTQLL